MKFIRRLLLFILVIIIIIGSVLYLNGNKLYKEKLSEISLENKVSSVRENSNFIKLNSLPTYYKDAVVSVEDRRFYSHGTIDFIALARATFSNIKQKDFKEGGSTITQQTAKNLYLIKEKDIINWSKYNHLTFLNCACKMTEEKTIDGEKSKRKEVKKLIDSLRKINPYIDYNIFKSMENINLTQILGYKKEGKSYFFLDNYNKEENK